jgi:DNA ligase (NAD+)
MDIDHLGPKLVEQLVGRGLVRSVADLFDLRVEALVPLERMEEKSAANVISAIENARRERSLARVINGLGMAHVGAVAAEAIAEWFGDLGAMLALDPSEVEMRLTEIDGVGPKMASSVARFLAAPRNREVVARLLAVGLGSGPVPGPRGRDRDAAPLPLAGKSFCVTGTLSRPRDEVHASIRLRGGAVHSSVKRGTDYLVAGERVGRAKLQKAASLGVAVISEAQLTELLERGTAPQP